MRLIKEIDDLRGKGKNNKNKRRRGYNEIKSQETRLNPPRLNGRRCKVLKGDPFFIATLPVDWLSSVPRVDKMKNGFLSVVGPRATFLRSGNINYGHPIETQATTRGSQNPISSNNSKKNSMS